jgi:glycosyltransferase involved in cell wall biosynthesis
MRVLMVSKACLVGAYQTKLTAIGGAADVELTVVVPPRWEDPAGPLELERAHLEGYDLRVSPIRFNGHFHLHYYPELPRLLRQLRPDILHMDEEPYNLATWRAIRAARRLDIRSLFFSWQNLNNRYPPPFSWLERQVLDWADYGLMGNRAAVEVWQAKGYGGPYAVIPQFGVSPDIFQPAPGPRPDGPLRIGCLNRRLVPEKGVDLLLEAVADLPFPWELRIAGEGEARAALVSQAAALGIAERVSFSGTVSSLAMPGQLAQLDVLVLPWRTRPNWKEQFGRVLIEAMACELPVVGSDSGEIPHVIGDAGLVYPEAEPAALRAHLLALGTDANLRARLGKAGRVRVLNQYTQEQIAAQTVAVYREILSRGKQRS